MGDKNIVSIEDMLRGSREEIARGLASLQETQREANVIFWSTPKAVEGSEGGPRDYTDSIEYDFLRGLRNVPEALLPYLNREGDSRRYLLDGAAYLESNAEQIATEILETRGPLPAREKDPHGEHSFPGGDHQHYSGGESDRIRKQLLEDTTQSLIDYAESIINVRYEYLLLDREPEEGASVRRIKEPIRSVEEQIVYNVKLTARECETEAEVTLYWDPEGGDKGMWLARVSGEFLEGYERSEQVFLPFERGPFTLNESACEKVLEGYKVAGKVDLKDVPTTSPAELEKLASVSNQ